LCVIVFMEVTDDPTVPVLQFRAVIVDSASGGNRKVLLAPDGQLDAVAWGNATAPSYFIKHVEIAQAVSPEITPLPLPGPDPLSATPLQVPWSEPSLDGFAIPLVAGHSTLMRIYVGDASLAPGQTATRQVGYKITGGPSPIQGTSQVTVTAPLDDPNQGVAASAINVWLPPNAAVAGGAGKTFDVEINPGQTETECAGCYPNGNEARLTGVQFVNNGDVTIRPTAITLIEKNGKIPPSPGYNAAFWHDLVRYLPIAVTTASTYCPTLHRSRSMCAGGRPPSTTVITWGRRSTWTSPRPAAARSRVAAQHSRSHTPRPS
jgi:hypothetical protein